MRRFLALARSATLEALAEPLSAILFLVALSTVHLAPAFHYHQFGEPGRLARECGFSALLVFGLVFATSAAVRAIGGEIASGTAAVALARPVPRGLFFCAKIAGVAASFGLFLVAVAAATVLATYSSAVGAVLSELAEITTTNVWTPGLASGIGFTLGGFILAALLNRFIRARFCVSACLILAVVQPLALLLVLPFGYGGLRATVLNMPWNIVPALGVLACGCCVFITLSGALAVRLKPAPTAALVAGSVLLSFVWPVRAVLPEINRFWLVDRLAGGGALPWGEAGMAMAAAACLVAFWLVAGSLLLQRRELP